MTLVVEITQADLMPDLISGLERSGCAADRVAPAVARVRDLGKATSAEARLELAFFVRAWQLGHPGVGVKISE
jgi:hypothetical protein